MKKILLAVMSAFLLFSPITSQAADNASGRVSMQQMKKNSKQRKTAHKQKIQARNEAYKVKKEAREAEMAERKRAYEEKMAAEAANSQNAYDNNGTANDIVAPLDNIIDEDTRPADEIQAEIEQTLKELRENVDHLQNEVNNEANNAPSASDSTSSSEE